MSSENEKHKLLQESLEKLVSQVSAYRDVIRLQYPSAQPMMQILHEMTQECLELVTSSVSPSLDSKNPMTKREREVLTEVSRGLLNKEIAYNLGISIRTVEFHLKSIFTKTSTQSRTEATVIAVKSGWITT